jgi:syntaxin 1B/2/3
MFQELAVLIAAQGEKIDSIENALDDANHYVEEAVEQLDRAQKTHEKGNKYMCCCLVCFACVMVIVVTSVLGVF